MGFALFVQTHIGKHLDARNNRVVDFRRKCNVGYQNTINAETYAGLVCERLDMNVGGALLCRVTQDCRNNFSNRRIFGYRLCLGLGDFHLLKGELVFFIRAFFFCLFSINGKVCFKFGQGLSHFTGEPFVLP